MRGQKKQKYTFFYVIIVVCLLVSGVAVYGLVNRIDTYRESEESYADIQAQALHTMAPTQAQTQRPAQTPAPEPGDADDEVSIVWQTGADDNGDSNNKTDNNSEDDSGDTPDTSSDNDESEGEEVEDDALLWLLENQNSTWQTVAPQTDAPDAVPTVTPEATAIPITTPDTGAPPTDKGKAVETGSPALPQESDALVLTTALPTGTPAPTATPAPTHSPVPEYMPKDGISMERAVTYEKARYYVDFNYLSGINPDVVGWLLQESSDINYPIVRGEDNIYYLDHMMDGSLNQNGTLFMDCGNSAAFIDEGSYVYGHNAKNGGMFALLPNYMQQEYYDAHPQMLLMSPFADYQIDLFAGIQTTVDDETSWRIKTFDNDDEFEEYIDGLYAQSVFAADKSLRPVWGDRMLVLVTCTNIRHGDRYVIYGRMRPIVYESAEGIELTKMDMDSRETESGYKQVGTLGEFMVYSQNDPLWMKMRYESRKFNKGRKFGDGGCGPTAVATVIANLVAPEKLPLLVGFADYSLGYTFCECSVNRYYCNHQHAQYQLRSSEEFLRYFPIAVANYASGNNMWGIQSRSDSEGTNMRYLESLCLIYRLRLSATRELEDALETLKQGNCLAVVSVSQGPYTSRGHYLVMAGIDEEYLYIIDPLKRDSYRGNYTRLVEILEPGISRIKLENVKHCYFNTVYIMEKTPET